MSIDFDIVIIGSGPGGYMAALKGASLGKKVLVIEKDDIGGVCLNKGCIPTKAIIESTRLYSRIKKADEFGISVSDISYNWEKILDRKNTVVQKLRRGIEHLFKKNNIEFINAFGEILDGSTVKATKADNSTRNFKCSKIILATGSVPHKIKGFESSLSSDDAITLSEIPKKITIIGGGALGIEFACIFNALGSSIKILEMEDRILNLEDRDVSSALSQILKRKGIDIQTNTKADTHNIPSDNAVLTTGRSFKQILVSNKMETDMPGVYAIGDVTGIRNYAHVAQMQGITAAENICGINSVMDYSAVPQCTFSDPEVASVGLTQDKAKDGGFEIKTSKFPYAALGKSVASSYTEGFVKIIADMKTDKILGCHIVGENASISIAEATLAIRNGLTTKDLCKTIHAHPTLPEAIWEAARGL